MKAFLLLAITLLSSVSSQEISVNMIDDLVFKFLEGAGVLEAYPDCEICHTSLTEMTDNFANKMMGIFDRNDELDKDGLIQAAFAMGIIPDLLRHCHGTAAHIVNAIDSFFRSFIDFEEFMGLLTENGTIVLAEVVMEARAIPDKSDDFQAIAQSVGKIVGLIFNFRGTKRGLLAPPPAETLLKATETEDDIFINMIRFGTSVLKASEIIPDDTEMKICGDSFINIDRLMYEGTMMVAQGEEPEGLFTLADTLKELGPLVQNCIDTYEDAVQNGLAKMRLIPDQTQLIMNFAGHINYIVLHLVQAQVNLEATEKNYPLAGEHLGQAFRYLFMEFDPTKDDDNE